MCDVGSDRNFLFPSLVDRKDTYGPTSAFIKQTELEDSPSPRKPVLGQSLVIGSLKTAQDGSYQSLISELTASGSTVDKLLVDHIIDQAAPLDISSLTAIHILLSEPNYYTFHLESFFSTLHSSLVPSGMLYIINPAPDTAVTLSSQLISSGFTVSSQLPSLLVTEKSSSAPALLQAKTLPADSLNSAPAMSLQNR